MSLTSRNSLQQPSHQKLGAYTPSQYDQPCHASPQSARAPLGQITNQYDFQKPIIEPSTGSYVNHFTFSPKGSIIDRHQPKAELIRETESEDKPGEYDRSPCFQPAERKESIGSVRPILIEEAVQPRVKIGEDDFEVLTSHAVNDPTNGEQQRPLYVDYVPFDSIRHMLGKWKQSQVQDGDMPGDHILAGILCLGTIALKDKSNGVASPRPVDPSLQIGYAGQLIDLEGILRHIKAKIHDGGVTVAHMKYVSDCLRNYQKMVLGLQEDHHEHEVANYLRCVLDYYFHNFDTRKRVEMTNKNAVQHGPPQTERARDLKKMVINPYLSPRESVKPAEHKRKTSIAFESSRISEKFQQLNGKQYGLQKSSAIVFGKNAAHQQNHVVKTLLNKSTLKPNNLDKTRATVAPSTALALAVSAANSKKDQQTANKSHLKLLEEVMLSPTSFVPQGSMTAREKTTGAKARLASPTNRNLDKSINKATSGHHRRSETSTLKGVLCNFLSPKGKVTTITGTGAKLSMTACSGAHSVINQSDLKLDLGKAERRTSISTRICNKITQRAQSQLRQAMTARGDHYKPTDRRRRSSSNGLNSSLHQLSHSIISARPEKVTPKNRYEKAQPQSPQCPAKSPKDTPKSPVAADVKFISPPRMIPREKRSPINQTRKSGNGINLDDEFQSYFLQRLQNINALAKTRDIENSASKPLNSPQCTDLVYSTFTKEDFL